MGEQTENHLCHLLTPASSSRIVPYYLYEFIKTYLYAVYTQMVTQPEFQVIAMTAKADLTNPRQQLVSVTDEEGSKYYKVSDACVEVNIRYNAHLYSVAVFREREGLFTSNRVEVLGLDPGARQPEDLLKFMSKQAVNMSSFHDAHLQVYSLSSAHSDIDFYVRRIELGADRLSDIYLPETVRDKVNLFINTLHSYSDKRRSLRYLFSGKPGTGKTKLIRAIANECKGEATFIFAEGSETSVDFLFEFVDHFLPVVLCIDDIDLMIGSRREHIHKTELAKLLQKLDGFAKNDFFLLATTNEKRLVDLAASRPGRFDMIIDVDLIHPEQYSSLVGSKTHEVEIRSLFDEEVLSLLERKKVTGAFIANLVKHLELVNGFEPAKVTREYLLSLINESFRGFYKEPEPTNGKMGFDLLER